MVNRKLVRPRLAEVKERFQPNRGGGTAEPSHRETTSNAGFRRRPAPPEQTNAEAFYYLKQMNSQEPMVVVLDDGEKLAGHLEWYDRSCVKVNRENAPNLLVYKHTIKYMYKLEDEKPERTRKTKTR